MPQPRLQSAGPHLIVALVTPFTTAGEIDHASLRRLVAHLQEAGIREFFAVGSTGESPLLDESDRRTILEAVRAAAPEATVYAGVSGMGHRHAIRNACDAAHAGADAAVLMSPFFVALDQEQLGDYCTRVADESPIPLTLYHHARMTTPFAIETIARLASHANIIALKDTNGGENNRCADVLAATAGQRFQFFQGVEKLVLPTLEAGGHGCVVAQGCIAPELFRELFAAWQAEQRPRARELQGRIEALWAIFSHPDVKRSFAHFLRTLKLPLHQRGVIASTAGALPGVKFDPEFDRMIAEFMQAHLPALARERAG